MRFMGMDRDIMVLMERYKAYVKSYNKGIFGTLSRKLHLRDINSIYNEILIDNVGDMVFRIYCLLRKANEVKTKNIYLYETNVMNIIGPDFQVKYDYYDNTIFVTTDSMYFQFRPNDRLHGARYEELERLKPSIRNYCLIVLDLITNKLGGENNDISTGRIAKSIFRARIKEEQETRLLRGIIPTENSQENEQDESII